MSLWEYHINKLIIVHNFALSHGHHAKAMVAPLWHFVLALSSTFWEISQYMYFQWKIVANLALTDSGDIWLWIFLLDTVLHFVMQGCEVRSITEAEALLSS